MEEPQKAHKTQKVDRGKRWGDGRRETAEAIVGTGPRACPKIQGERGAKGMGNLSESRITQISG